MKARGYKLLEKLTDSGFGEELDRWGLGKVDLRMFAGLTGGLYAYNPDRLPAEEAVDRFYDFIAGIIGEYVRERKERETTSTM